MVKAPISITNYSIAIQTMHRSNSYTVSANDENGQIEDKAQPMRRQHEESDTFDSSLVISSSVPNPSSYANRSASIPITSATQHQLAEDAASVADYRDYLFYSRVVGGIKSTTEKQYQNDTLQHENQVCLDNIVRTRHEDTEALNNSITYGYDDRILNDTRNLEPDDEGVFVLDL
jgi:hypothetical protein